MKRFTLLLAFSFFQIILFAQNGLLFTASNETAAAGSTVCVKVTTTNFTNVGSFQFSMNWNKNVATFLELKNFGLTGLASGNFNPNADSSGMVLNSVWNSPDGQGKSLPNGTVLFEICFTTVGASSTAITFSDVPNVREATDATGNVISFSQQNGSITISGGGKDCPSLNLNFNDPCNDNIQNTMDDKVNSSCQCVGIPTQLNIINCPTDISATAAAGQNSAVVNYVDPAAVTTCFTGFSFNRTTGLASGAAFPLGTTQVCFVATDGCGNYKSCCFNVAVSGTTIYVLNLNCPQNITVNAAARQTTATVNYTSPVGTSNCPTGAVVTSKIAGPTSGEAFPLGTSSVIYSASDGCGNLKTCSFTVTVNQTDPPPNGCTGNLLKNADFSNAFSNWWSYQANITGGKAEICNGDGGCGQSADGVAGKTYRLSVSAALSNPGVNAQMTLKFLDANGNELDAENAQFIYQNSPQPQVLEAKAPAGTRFVQIHCWKSPGSGCLSMDDWCLTDDGTTPPPPSDCGVNLLQNANFSAGLASWWYYLAAANSGSGQVCGNDGGFGQTVLAQVGATYVFNVKAALGSADSRALVGLKFMDADGKLLGSEISTLIKNTSLQDYALTGKAPAGAYFAQVWCWKSYGGGCVSTRDWCLGKSGNGNLAINQPLLVFNAFRDGAVVKLNWVNRTGGLNDFFVVERRSFQDDNWQPILKTNGMGTAGEILYFNELDKKPLAGENFYRLKWMLKDGKTNFSEIVKIQMPELPDAFFELRPNPARDFTMLIFSENAANSAELQISDAAGRLFLTKNLKNSDLQQPLKIGLEGFAGGIYFLKLKPEGQRELVKRFVVVQE